MNPVVVPPTVKFAVATLLLESMTVIVWFPERPAGIVKYTMNAPAPFGVAVAGTVLTIEVPTSTTIAEFGVNAFPMICTVEPTGPEVGVKMIVGGVKAKYAVAVLPDLSVTITVLFKRAVNGTTNSVKTLPPDPVVPAAAVIKAPLTVTLNAVPEVAKPVPSTSIHVPLSMSVVWKIVIDGTTVNVVNALLTPSPNSIVYAPPVICGTMNHVVRL